MKPFDYVKNLQEALGDVVLWDIEKAIEAVQEVKNHNGTVYTFGNGGSAATASHFANDLLKMGGVKAVCLSDMNPTQLALMNDEGYELMWSGIIPYFMNDNKSKDAWVAISCSGNSQNVIRCVEEVIENRGENDCLTIGLTGNVGGKLGMIADIAIHAPHEDIRIQEDVHLTICHIVAGSLT